MFAALCKQVYQPSACFAGCFWRLGRLIEKCVMLTSGLAQQPSEPLLLAENSSQSPPWGYTHTQQQPAFMDSFAKAATLLWGSGPLG